MEERTTGVVLRVRLLTETSLIVHWLTADAGRIATVARGARRPKSPFRGKLDLFHEADLTFRRARTGDLHQLSEIALRATHPALRTDWARLQQAAYGVALIEQTTETDTPLPEVWQIFRDYLGYLGTHPGAKATQVMALELKLLEVLGLSPDLETSRLPTPSRELAAWLLRASWEELGGLTVAAPALESLAGYLRVFLAQHLGRVPRGRQEALSAGSA